MATDTPYPTDEARDLIARETDRSAPDYQARQSAAYDLVKILVSLSTDDVTFSPSPRDGFRLSIGGADLRFYVTKTGEIVVGEKQTQVSGLEYNPLKNIFEGPVLEGEVGWPKRRRSAVAVLVEQLLGALRAKIGSP